MVNQTTMFRLNIKHNGHEYVFTWLVALHDEMLRSVAQQAADPDHPMSWLVAAHASRRIRESADVSTQELEI